MRIAVRRLAQATVPMVALALFANPIVAQGRGGQGSTPVINQSTDPLLASFRFRSIGPASMGGRVHDVEVASSDPNVIYVAYAVGGIFKSENNGTTFAPVFDTYPTASFGDLAIHPTNADIVYAGTGEANNRQTSSFGDGIYKTTDGGKTWTNLGLKETQTISRVLIDPRNPEVVYVAANGHLFGPSPDRGVYKTTDGGKTWAKVKFVDDNTGFTDLAMDPSNSNTLYAASYQRRRSGCCFNGGGPGSALWKTDDAGRTWTKLTGGGLPPGTYGRIALDVSRSNPNIVYAQIEAGALTPPVATAAPAAGGAPGAVAGGGGGGGGGGRGGFDWCNNGAAGGGAAGGRGARAGGAAGAPQTPPVLDVARGGIFRSDNKGRTWTHVSNCNARPMYFSKLRVDPSTPNTIYVAGLPWAKSLDGGRTFATLDNAGGNNSPGHVDQHAMWAGTAYVAVDGHRSDDLRPYVFVTRDYGRTFQNITNNLPAYGNVQVVREDPKNRDLLYVGTEFGLYASLDGGKSWQKFMNNYPTVRTDEILVHPRDGDLIVATHGRG